MKLTKKLESEILKTYNDCWEAYLAGDLKTHASFLSTEFKIIGTSESEQFDSKKAWIAYCKKTINQFAGVIKLKKRHIELVQAGEEVMVVENSHIYVLIESKWTFYSNIRISALLQKTNTGWKYIYQHGSLPDAKANEGEVIATEQIKAENLQLKDAVKRRTVELEQKNRELEIETALEKARTVAMGMKEPADMPDVCKAISLQLQSLGVDEIRNVQTAIFYESRGTYMNYEYYTKHKKTIITETVYTNHKIASGFAKKMLQGKGEIFITHIKGKKVKEWLAYQKTTNVFIDRFLEKAGSLNYYWHSLGPVALGISTYTPLSKEDLSLFNRFLNVFELAYTRYLDIEQAIAQAKEAKIEASLERVRAQAMSMHKPGDLLTVSEILFAELQALGFSELRNAMINIFDDERGSFLNYDYSAHAGKSIANLFYNTHPVIEKQIQQARTSEDAFSEAIFAGKDLEDWKEFRRKGGEADDPRVNKINALYYYFYSIGTGVIGISTYSSIAEEKRNVLKRFRNVFDLAYRRFMDIEQAEAQAREAQIEAALEKVRAQALAMHKPDELLNVSEVLYKELKHLGFDQLRNAIIHSFNDEKGYFRDYDYADITGGAITNIPYSDHPIIKRFLENIKASEKAFSHTIIAGNELKEWKKFRKKGGQLDDPRLKKATALYYYIYSIGIGAIGISTFEAVSEEKLEVLKRFRNVFDFAYRRYMDIARAEEQAREAQIELSLERVRAMTMAMRTTNDLSAIIGKIYQELTGLDMVLDRCFIMVFDENEQGVTWWTAGRENMALQHGYFVKHHQHEPHLAYYNAWKDRKEKWTYILEGDTKKKWSKFLFSQTELKISPNP